MNRYKYEEDFSEEVIPKENLHLGSNIKQLRIEKRLSIVDIANKVEVEEEVVKKWESGEQIPTEEQVKKLLPILKISYYDIMTRDIVAERNATTIQMKKSKTRKDYNWYYGDRKRILLYSMYLIGVPAIFLVMAFALGEVVNSFYSESTIYEILQDKTKFVIAYLVCSILSGIIITIRFFGYIHYQFQWWHIFWISLFCWVVVFVGVILTIPYYIYILICLIRKKGRNHV